MREWRIMALTVVYKRNRATFLRNEGARTQIAFLRWSNVGSTLYTTMTHGWHTTLDQCSYDRWRMVG